MSTLKWKTFANLDALVALDSYLYHNFEWRNEDAGSPNRVVLVFSEDEGDEARAVFHELWDHRLALNLARNWS